MSGPSGVAIMDLDDFKVHNDTYGHHGGDIALEVVADVVKGNIRKCDSLIRFGGDEFLLILANMPEKTLKKKLEKIRDQVHAGGHSRMPAFARERQHRRCDAGRTRDDGQRRPPGRQAALSCQDDEKRGRG